MEKLRNRSGLWMITTISFMKENEDGTEREVREQYVVEAASFIEAETRIRKEMEYNNRPIDVMAITKPGFDSVCFNDDADADKFYKVKVCIIEDVDVRSRKGGVRTKTKVQSYRHLVQASSVDGVRQAIKEVVYKDTMDDYEIADIVKTNILEVLEYDRHLMIG